MRRVILESPWHGDIDKHTAYACQAMHDSLMRGEAPMVSHLLYTQVLDDKIAAERQLGIEAGLAWTCAAEATVVYADLGISTGMQMGIDRAVAEGRPVETRKILQEGEEWI